MVSEILQITGMPCLAARSLPLIYLNASQTLSLYDQPTHSEHVDNSFLLASLLHLSLNTPTPQTICMLAMQSQARKLTWRSCIVCHQQTFIVQSSSQSINSRTSSITRSYFLASG